MIRGQFEKWSSGVSFKCLGEFFLILASLFCLFAIQMPLLLEHQGLCALSTALRMEWELASSLSSPACLWEGPHSPLPIPAPVLM